MIGNILKYIIAAINQDFNDPNILDEPKVVPGNIAFIDAFQDTAAQTTTDKLIASVVNITQDGSLRNLPFRQSTTNDEGIPVVEERQPELWLNVFILFGANRTDYSEALDSISKIIGFFQRKHVFTPAELQSMIDDGTVVELPNVNKLVFDLYSMSFEELNQLWGVMGGKYIPSVLYKMRMAIIQEASSSLKKPIEAIGAEPKGL